MNSSVTTKSPDAKYPSPDIRQADPQMRGTTPARPAIPNSSDKSIMQPLCRGIRALCLIMWLSLAAAPTTQAQSVDMYGVFGFNRVGSAVTVGVEYIQNYRPLGTVSGTLVLQLWATDLPHPGGLLVGYKLCEIPLGTLLGGYYLHNVVRSSSFAAPPDGNYNIVFVLAEWQGFSYATVDWENFNVRQNFGFPPQIVSAATTVGDVGSPFYFQVLAIYNPQAFAASGLPPGLTINQYTGVMRWTPLLRPRGANFKLVFGEVCPGFCSLFFSRLNSFGKRERPGQRPGRPLLPFLGVLNSTANGGLISSSEFGNLIERAGWRPT